MQNSATTWALVPIKDFARAKSRLRPVLTARQCAELAECMAVDVLDALRASKRIDGVICLGGPRIRTFAERHGCAFMAEHPGDGLLANLDRAARELEQKGARTLLIVPGDLPTIGAADLDACLARHRDGLTICPAERDGGTNVLVVSPPTGIGFRFGEQSCAKHVEAAATAGLDYRIDDLPAFRHDIDVPADLAWLCGAPPQGRTGRFIARTGLAKRIRNATGHPPSAAIA